MDIEDKLIECYDSAGIEILEKTSFVIENSLQFVSLVVNIEQAFQIEFLEDELDYNSFENFDLILKTVNDRRAISNV